MKNKFIAIVLAGGIGKRMKSDKSKVLHSIGGKPMIQKSYELLEKAGASQIIVVGNPQNIDELKNLIPKAKLANQKVALGTADATGVGLSNSSINTKHVAVLYGDDTAFYKPETIKKVFAFHLKSEAKITFVTIKKENPAGLGRIVRVNGKLKAIVEEKDATEEQKKIKEINDGLYFFDKDLLKKSLKRLLPSKVTGELYITDVIVMALKENEKVETFTLDDNDEWHGINTQIELAKANLKLNKKIHIMGISGAGAAAVAGLAQAFGFKVTGCDINPSSSYFSEFKIIKGHSREHIGKIACLILSPAILKVDTSNPEILEAKEKGIPTITWQEFQGAVLMENKFTIAVAGSFGKSTTTAMIGKILLDANYDPIVEVGAKVLDWNTNYKFGKSKYYVCEADEYSDNFLNYHPDIAVVLNLKWEHPDYFKTINDCVDSYVSFINNIKNNGCLVTTSDVLKIVKKRIRKDIRIVKVTKFESVKLQLIGNFRRENANAALTVARLLNINPKLASKSVNNFTGLGRRLELKGIIRKTIFYDDYAVQPYTILKTADSLREKYPRANILLVIEPHTLSRVNTFFKEFETSFKNVKVEQIFITDTFAARETGDERALSKRLSRIFPQKTTYTGSVNNTAREIIKVIHKYDVVLTMGAGDVYKIFNLIKDAKR